MHGSGCHIGHKEKLSALFAKKYNAKDINMAKDGGNNDRSVRKIVDWVVQNKDKLDETIFLLGLSGPEIYELWDEERGCYAGGCYGPEVLLRIKKSDIKKRMTQYEKMALLESSN